MTDVAENYLDFDSILVEMGPLSTAGSINVPINQDLYERIKNKDNDAKFAVFEVESGVSRSKRNWKPEHLEKIAKFINEHNPVAYKGHISERDDATAFPTVHAIWLGAIAQKIGDKAKLLMKCYLKTPEIRDEVELKMVDAVSVHGFSTLRPSKGVYEIVNFEPESIDFARKGRNGMPSRLVALTGEMSNEGGNKVEPKDIAALDEQELRLHNPLLVKHIEDEATKPLTTKVSEMETSVAALKPQVDVLGEIRTKLGLGENDNPIDAVAELLEKVEQVSRSKVADYIKEAIKKHAKTDRAAKLVHRLVGEMEDISELTDESKKKIDDHIKEICEKDEDVKAIIGEMGSTSSIRNDTGGAGLGGQSRQDKVDEKRSRTGGVVFGKTKLGGGL